MHGRFFGYSPEYGKIYTSCYNARAVALHCIFKDSSSLKPDWHEWNDWDSLPLSIRSIIAFCYCVFHEEEMDEVVADKVKQIAVGMKKELEAKTRSISPSILSYEQSVFNEMVLRSGFRESFFSSSF